MKKKQTKPRKPMDFVIKRGERVNLEMSSDIEGCSIWETFNDDISGASIEDPRHARRIANWLNQWADWVESKQCKK